MANSLLTSSIILDRALAVLSQKPTFLNMINTQYDSRFKSSGAAIGDTVSVRLPQRAVIRDGRVMNIQPQVNQTVPVTISKYKGVDTGATSLEMALDIDDFQAQFIDQKIPDLVAAVESDVLSTVMPLVPQVAGDYGLLNDISTILDAGVRLDNSLAPVDGRRILCNSNAGAQFVNAQAALFNNQSKIANQYDTGRMGKGVLGFDWDSTTLMPSLTRGSATALYVTNGAFASGNTITVATGTGTFAVGDVFTMEGVNAVHPQTKQDLGYLKQFTVTTAFAGGAGNLTFSPAIVSTGSEQNVTNGVATGKKVLPLGTLSTTYQQSLAFTRDAFYFVTADLPNPKGMGVDVAVRTWNGVTMRFMNGFDIVNDMYLSRFDILYGAGVLRPELAVRLPNIAA